MGSNNKTIVKNTIYLYFRMMFTMLVALYTSRVVLDVLGVNDYGTYQAVGGIVAMLSFMNGALSNGTSRFLMYELGTGNYFKLKRTFSSLLILHICIAVIIVVLSETVGLWFVKNKMVIPSDRMEAALFTYHISVLTSIITITQVPYNASIISHEKMSIYAYLSIIETILKLGIVYMLSLFSWDKLKLYAFLLFIVQLAIASCYRWYCIKQFEETRFRFIWNKEIIKDVLNYSVWNLISSISIPLKNQGLLVLLNMFFSPAIVAARSLANQVNMAANQFILNFRTAANPQIVKRYASGDIIGSKRLLLNSTKYSFYLMIFLCLPICLLTEPLLNLWLIEIPEYTVPFLQLAVISSLFQVFDNSFYTALYTIGRIKENALISPVIGILVFPIVFYFFKVGYSPLIMAWILLFFYMTLGMIVKPILLVKYANYHWSEILLIFKECFVVLFCAALVPTVVHYLLVDVKEGAIIYSLFILLICFSSTSLAIWYFGLTNSVRCQLVAFIKKKLSSNIN